MNRNKTKSGLALLMVFILLFAGLGTSAFAAKPPKEPKLATIQVIEPQPLLIPLGASTVEFTLVVMYHDGNEPVLAPSIGTANLISTNEKKKQTEYTIKYTKPDSYSGEGMETVLATVYNTVEEPVPTTETIYIQIETDTPPPEEYTITTAVLTDGVENPAGGTAAGDGTYEENTPVNLTATANVGYEFSGWYADAGLTNLLSEDITYGIIVNGDRTYYAAFESAVTPPPEYTITTVVMTDGVEDPAGGTADGDGSYAGNTPVDLTAVANSGYEFSGWYADAGLSNLLSIDATYGIIVTGDATYYAAFESIVTPPPENLLYVVLGDSIATGTVAPSMPNETPYIHAFRSYLAKETGRTVDMSDFSEDGDQTGHLLARLGGPAYDGVGADQTMINQVKAADVITVSIGGNNLMSAAKYTTYVFFFIRVDYYDFDRIDTDKAEAGRAAVENDFPLIIQKIRQYNSTAKIVVNDLYNPFNKSSDAANYNLVEGYFYRGGIGVNDVIRRECNDNSGIEYAEVYAAFEGYGGGDKKEQITYMYIQDTYFGFELRNPHPNSIGQGLIETAVENAYDRIPVE